MLLNIFSVMVCVLMRHQLEYDLTILITFIKNFIEVFFFFLIEVNQFEMLFHIYTPGQWDENFSLLRHIYSKFPLAYTNKHSVLQYFISSYLRLHWACTSIVTCNSFPPQSFILTGCKMCEIPAVSSRRLLWALGTSGLRLL